LLGFTADEEVSIFMTGRINQKEITHGLAAMSGGKFGSKYDRNTAEKADQ
jgi:hypothetical protein